MIAGNEQSYQFNSQQRSPLLWILVLFIVVILLWLCLGRVEISSNSRGMIRPVGEVKVIQSFVNGVVEAIHVAEGDKISQGQLLISLDRTELMSEKSQLQQNLHNSRSYLQDYRLLANLLKPEAQGQGLSALGLSIFLEYRAKSELFAQKIKKLQLELELAKQRIAHETKLLTLVESKIAIYQSLDTQDAIPKIETLDLQTSLLELGNRKLTESQRYQTLKEDIASTKAEIKLYQAEYLKNIMEKRDSFENDVFNSEKELAKINKKLEHQQIRSPIDGTMDNLALNTLGGVVSVSQNIATIVPENNALLLESEVKNKDVGFIRLGQEANIKLDSFPFAKYGMIEGEVIAISPHSLENKESEMVYKLKFSLPAEQIEKFSRLGNEIRSGMTATAEVKTGERRIIEYLLSPIIESIDESLTER